MGKSTSGWARAASPFHAGEHAIQTRLGVRERMEGFGRRVVRDYLPEQHRAFHGALPLVFLGHVDTDDRPWASVVVGRPGFFHSPDPHTLRLAAPPLPGDPLADALAPGLAVGMLGIELGTRRRNRVNGRVTAIEDGAVTIAVDQSFGNCPQYIQTRTPTFAREPGTRSPRGRIEHLLTLSDDDRALIRAADTFWVASASHDPAADPAATGADISHRGGRPGFVGVEGDTLTIPDYAGNQHFNTLGNILLNPRAGLLFVDFDTGNVLMLTGSAEILWGGREVAALRGAERAWRFTVTGGRRLTDSMPLRWAFGEWSPDTLATGDRAEAERVLAAERRGAEWRRYRVARIVDESTVVRSFHLEPEDGEGLLPYRAGQHLSIRVTPEGAERPQVRTYTLSSAPFDRHYRISVKREPARDDHAPGLVSGHLHTALEVGDLLEARAPAGHFVIDTTARRPALLVAGGVGVTPMIAMARHVAHEGLRTGHRRPLTVLHAVRTTSEAAFADELRALARDSAGALHYLSVVSRPMAGERAGVDFDVAGRIDADLLRGHLSAPDLDVFLCGPPSFMQAVYDTARALGVADRRIFTEAFGPSSLTRRPDAAATVAPPRAQVLEAVVRFVRSGFEQRWSHGDGSLLEVAEAHGLDPEHGCRAGRCGACAVRLTAGAVTYRTAPAAPVREGEVLICCATPATETIALEL